MHSLLKKDLPVRILAALLTLAILLGLRFYAVSGRVGWELTPSSGTEYARARVLRVLEDKTQPNEAYENVTVGTQELEIEILSGRYAGDQLRIRNYLSPFLNHSIPASEGTELSVRIITTEVGEYTVSVDNYNRSPWLWVFLGIFLLALIAVGGKQGLAAIFGLGFTMLGVLFVLIPLLVQKGWPPIPATLLIVLLTMLISYILIGGMTAKTFSALLGSFGGVLLAGLFAWIAGKLVHISGLNMDEAEALFLTAADNGLQVRGLFICGILIAAEGAIMDISMSVASAVEEVSRVDPTLSAGALFRSGMRVGRDAMGTMVNTLILAFAGTGLNTMLFLYAYDVSYIQLINADFVSMELIRGLAGSLGMILCVPLVSFLAGRILTSSRFGRRPQRQ